MYHASVVADEAVLDAQTVSTEHRERRNEEREPESETEKKGRQRDNKTEKVTVSGRRMFTPTNYDSRCRYAPF